MWLFIFARRVTLCFFLFCFFAAGPRHGGDGGSFFFEVVPFEARTQLLHDGQPPRPAATRVNSIPPPDGPSNGGDRVGTGSVQFHFKA